MTVQFVLLPLFVHVAFVFVALLWGGPLRRSYAMRGPSIAREAYDIELAVLFYTLTILAWITKQADLLFVILAWVFVIAQIVPLVLSFGRSPALRPSLLFTVAIAVLALMWLIFALRLLLRL
jgi:hypothetical protein